MHALVRRSCSHCRANEYRATRHADQKNIHLRVDPRVQVADAIQTSIPQLDGATKMTTGVLKSLTKQFAAMPKIDTTNPTISRRKEIVGRLEQQLKLAQDPNYVRVVKTKAGPKEQKVQPLWKVNADGTCF